MSTNKIIYTEEKHDYPITLYQATNGLFTVQYGKQLDTALDYAEAAAKLGEAIMHACACDGLIDNEVE